LTTSSRPAVLIVEDEPSILSTYRMILEEEGYEVSACDTYRCGRKRLEERVYDAALIDIQLEQEDLGLVLAQEAKTLRHPPVIILSTGYPTLDRLRRALNLRVDYLVLKPAEAEEVTDVLRRSLARRRLMHELSRIC
jgi:DNA-binding NtrC family response regulator